MRKNIAITVFSVFILSMCGCEKFLEEKSDRRLTVPVTLQDFQDLLNNVNHLNNDFISAGEVSSDDFYLSDADFNTLQFESDKRLYTWQPDYVSRPQAQLGDEWYNTYRGIYVCNSVLHGIDDNDLTGSMAENIKGQALVFRAARYLDGVQVWSPAYNRESAHTDLGMVIRLDPDINSASIRATVEETYDAIIKDLSEAISLLPTSQTSATLPAKDAAYGLLARTYLYMGEYEKALKHAHAALGVTKADVIDFNNLTPNADFPIPAIKFVSKETIFWTPLFSARPLSQAVSKITSSLYNLYEEKDLRKAIYFEKDIDNTIFFKGTHFGYFGLMSSLTIPELLLVVAECHVRLGNFSDASEVMNQLIIKRHKQDAFISYEFTDSETALHTVLLERRKELVMRGLRWADIKRLNRDGYDISLERTVNGQTYTLPPNDLRYAIAIPETVIEISGIQQNPR